MPPPAASAAERRPSAWSAYIQNHSGPAASDSGPVSPTSSAPPPISPARSWFRRGSASASDPHRIPVPAPPSYPSSSGDEFSPTRQAFPSSTRQRDANAQLDVSRQAHTPSPPSPGDFPAEGVPASTFYPKPVSIPSDDGPPPVMPPPVRSGRPIMDPDAAAAERARRAEEHRIKMRERKETQAVEALMHQQERRMSRRSAKKPTNFVPRGRDIPPVPVLPERNSVAPPPNQADVDDQGRRSTLETNLDSLIAENSVEFPPQGDAAAAEEGSLNGGHSTRPTVSQAPSFPILDALTSQPKSVARVPSYASLKGSETRDEYRLSAAISLRSPDATGSSYAPAEGEPSPLDSAFGMGPVTPNSATGVQTSNLLTPAGVHARPLRREKSLSSTYLRRSIGESETELLPNDGKSRDATELFKYEEQLGPTKRVSVLSRTPSSNGNARTVSILKYTDNPQQQQSAPSQKDSVQATSADGFPDQIDESVYDADDDFAAFEDLTLTRRFAHLCMIFPYAILGMLVRFGLDTLFTYDGSSISSLLWAQGISAAMFGLVLGKREDLTTLYPPIWTGVSVGFAGSINSFSGWMLEAFMAFSNFNNYNRGVFQNILDGTSQLAVTLVIVHGAMSFGIHCARYLPSLPEAWLTSPSRFSPTPRADILAIVLSVAAYVVAIVSYSFFGAQYWRYQLVFPMILAPGGAVLRYYLSRLNATREPLGGANGIPLGTFVSNLLGTGILAACYILMRLDLKSSLSTSQCAALNSLSIGLAGTMTNLAAMMFEARAFWLTNRWRWAYVLGSMACGQALVVAIFGGLWWGGSVSAVCSMR